MKFFRSLIATAVLLVASLATAQQTINPDQIRPSSTSTQVLGQSGGKTAWTSPSISINDTPCILNSSCSITITGSVLLNPNANQNINQNSTSLNVNLAGGNSSALNLNVNTLDSGYYNNSGPWSGVDGLNLHFFNTSKSITHGVSGNFSNMTVGDSAWMYFYALFYGGNYFGSDEALQGINGQIYQVGYQQAYVVTPSVGSLYQNYHSSATNVAYIQSGTFPSGGNLTTLSLTFLNTPVAGTGYFYTFTPGPLDAVYGQPESVTITSIIPVTVAAATGTQTWTAANFGTIAIPADRALASTPRLATLDQTVVAVVNGVSPTAPVRR
jgi:hypothetical protein